MSAGIVEIVYRYEARKVPARARPEDPDAARLRLERGNRAFAALLAGPGDEGGIARRIVPVDPRDFGLLPSGRKAPLQRPFAAVLGCSDARVPIELIFNEGPNDLFVVRVAGNVLGDDALGSLRYAVDHLGGSLRLIVVLGHSGCGAVSEAVDIFLNPALYLPIATSHSLRNIVDRLLVVVQASANRLRAIWGAGVVQRPGYRRALIEVTVIANAALGAHTLQREMSGGDRGGVRAACGVYVLESHEIWAPRGPGSTWNALADPPTDDVSWVKFGDAVVQSERIASLLDTGAG